jgi:hypothetical protein
MLYNIIEKLKQIFSEPSEQSKLDAFIAQQQPTSVGDVEYWINVYDRRQYLDRSSSFSYHIR